MKANSACKSVWLWMHKSAKAYLALATDDMLYMSTSDEPLKILLAKVNDLFLFEVKRGKYISFLNYRIVQTEYGISMDQTNHETKCI